MPLSWIDRRPRLVAFLYLAVVPVAIAVIVAGGAVDHYRNDARVARLARQGKQAHDAICVLRSDLEQRVRATGTFLADHPAGFPGVPAAAIKVSLANQKATITALSFVNCDTKGTP